MALPRGVATAPIVQLPGATTPVTGTVNGVALTTEPALVTGTADSYEVDLTADEMDAELVYVLVTDAADEEYGITLVTEPPLASLFDGTGELALKSVVVDNDAGTAVEFKSTGGNGHGLLTQGDGWGSGLSAWGGAADGDGIQAFGTESGSGLAVHAMGLSGNGIRAVGGEGAAAVLANGGIYAQGVGGRAGLDVIGSGSGPGLRAKGGSGFNAPGARFEGGAGTDGDALSLVGSGAGLDINGDVATETKQDAAQLTLDFLTKNVINQLVQTDNQDGTWTIELLDDDDATVLKTWTFTEATQIRTKAV